MFTRECVFEWLNKIEQRRGIISCICKSDLQREHGVFTWSYTLYIELDKSEMWAFGASNEG